MHLLFKIKCQPHLPILGSMLVCQVTKYQRVWLFISRFPRFLMKFSRFIFTFSNVYIATYHNLIAFCQRPIRPLFERFFNTCLQSTFRGDIYFFNRSMAINEKLDLIEQVCFIRCRFISVEVSLNLCQLMGCLVLTSN